MNSAHHSISTESGQCANATPTPDETAVVAAVRRHAMSIRAAAWLTGVRSELIMAVMATESGGVSRACSGSAYGLMQLVPAAWADVRRSCILLRPFSFRRWWACGPVNVLFGARFLQLTQRRLRPVFDADEACVLAAYNGGRRTVTDAFRHAEDRGETDPAGVCLEARHLVPALEQGSACRFYMQGPGRGRNPSGTPAEAATLKYREICTHRRSVQRYLSLLDDGACQ